MHYYKRNIGNYYKQAAGLSLLEHGAYVVLYDAIVDRETWPTEEEALLWCYAKTAEEKAAVRSILHRFYEKDGLVFTNKIITDLFTRYSQTRQTNKKAAQSRYKNSAKRDEAQTNCDETKKNADETSPNQGTKELRNQGTKVFHTAYVKPAHTHTSNPAEQLAPDWQPDPQQLTAAAIRAGVDPLRITPDVVGEFVNYHAKGAYHSQAQWLAKLVNWAKRQPPPRQPSRESETIDQAGERIRARVARLAATLTPEAGQ